MTQGAARIHGSDDGAMPPSSGRIPIAFVIDEMLGGNAGTESQLVQTIERLDRRIFSPVVVVLRPSRFLERGYDSCEVLALHVYHLLTIQGMRDLLRLSRWLKEHRIAIVQTFFKDSTLLGLIAATLARVPVRIASRRSLKYKMSPLDHVRYRCLDPLVDVYLVNGHAIAEELEKTENVRSQRIRIFYNLVSTSIANVYGSRRRLNQDVNILFVANIRPVKGHDFFFAAVEELLRSMENINVVVVGGGEAGEGPECTGFYQKVKESCLLDRFTFVGLRDDVSSFLLEADIGVLCSWSEGFSSSVLEYIASGLPCVATDVGSNGEMIVDGVNGFLVPFGDVDGFREALQKLCRSSKLRTTMGEASRCLFERKFRPEVEIRRLEEFYKSTLEERRGRGV